MAAVTVPLNYFVPPPEGIRPWVDINFTFDPSKHSLSKPNEGRNWVLEPRQRSISNLRGKEDTVSLDKEGFQYVKHVSKEKDFTDDEKIQEYYEESVELIKNVTGASRAVVFDHTIRRQPSTPTPNTPSSRQPVLQVHVDQTPESARNRVIRHLPEADVPALLSKRFQIINLWRPIGYAAIDRPLALCDYSTIDPQTDLVPSTLRYPDREGEIFQVKFNNKHAWKYVKGMTPEEVVLIKCFDSVQDGSIASLTPHTAFIDPTTPPGAPLRQSIELRLLVFYD